MHSCVFPVVDEPYCLWEEDLATRNRAFLDGIDPDYFSYVLQAHLESEDQKRASVAIRTSLHHATEAMFSLLGAMVQAPDCSYAWIAKCSNFDLRRFVDRVSRKDSSLPRKLTLSAISWTEISAAVFAVYKPGSERHTQTVECFARLWADLASELKNEVNIDEYNALKHGFRARPGGFEFRMGGEHEHGIPPPKSEMKSLGQSDYGATYLKIEKFASEKGSRHLRSRQFSVNWSFERIVLLHQLVFMSINNIVSALKVVNGYDPSKCRFVRPKDDSDFKKPWSYSTGVVSINLDIVVDEARVPVVSKAELLKMLNPND